MRQRQGLSNISLHSGRIRGVMEAAVASVGRADIMEAGGWVSDAVDAYIRPQGKGNGVNRALVRHVNC